MAEERIGAPEGEVRTYWGWTELFRTFQVALDPKKLLLAAIGIFVMWAGWWVLSFIFYQSRSEPKRSDYAAANYVKNNNLTEEEAQQRAQHDYDLDSEKYQLLYRMAGPGDVNAPEPWKHVTGQFRVAPWDENRGPNPFKLVTGQIDRPWNAGQFFDWFATQQMPVLIEPLVKFLRPIVYLLNPHAGGWNRIYLLLITFWTLATWALFGGAITRLAAVQLAGKDRPGLIETLRFVGARYLSYLSAPLVPLVFVAVIVLLTILYGLIHLIPFVGDIADSIAWPFLMLLGFGQAVLLIGLVGYPLMYATVSAEGSDTFDALSRSYNYVFQSPWNYIWYSFVAVVYGAVLVFFVVFMGSFVVYLTKWSLSQTPGTEYFATRRVDTLFEYAPTTFGWRDLLVTSPPVDTWYNQISAVVVSLWVTLVLLLVLGFAYSYYFTAFTMVYLLMRRKVDDTELDEVYLEEDEPEEPLLPPSAPAAAPSGTATPLAMVEPPALRTPPAAPVADGNLPVTPPPPTAAPADTGAATTAPPERPTDGATPAS
jgi:hypothetical protein